MQAGTRIFGIKINFLIGERIKHNFGTRQPQLCAHGQVGATFYKQRQHMTQHILLSKALSANQQIWLAAPLWFYLKSLLL